MTAEIAVLNKSAVALAADSAVTISAGSNQEKIYDSADKLFELSNKDPIGVMVNGGMNFMQAPLGVLVKKFRSDSPTFAHVTDAAEAFLAYLNHFGAGSPQPVKDAEIIQAIAPTLRLIKDRAQQGFFSRVFDDDGIRAAYAGDDGLVRARADLLSEQIEVMRIYLEKFPAAEFVGGAPVLEGADRAMIVAAAQQVFDNATPEQIEAATDVAVLAILRAAPNQASTGLVVAGFGFDDLFPTLVSFELYGSLANHLKFVRVESVDIDRGGARARVIPFAQREMVERFLYGLDGGIQRSVTQFCRGAIPNIRARILQELEMDLAARQAVEELGVQAEEAFLEGLSTESFETIRQESQTEIEDMVEFMPKSEMARMAEALVNLTSIKRRVSRGMETVGGPIDVAIISQAEGFVWVKRKHYFPQELNARYFDRKRAEIGEG